MDGRDRLAERFEEHRGRLRGVAYRMLGSLAEAEDAVQDAWLHLSGADASEVQNLGRWLTTVVARVCLDMLRSRKARREEPLEDAHVPDPILSPEPGASAGVPEHEAVLADSVGLALLVVLDRLAPAERLAFVLHDIFGMPFEEIAPLVERTPTAARQLASRARRRVQGAAPVPDPDIGRQREAVNAFLAAAREGDFDGLLAVLDPEVVLRADYGPGASRVVRGAANVAQQTSAGYARFGGFARRALVNGAVGVFAYGDGKLWSVMGFTVSGRKIVEIDILADPERLGRVDLSAVLG